MLVKNPKWLDCGAGDPSTNEVQAKGYTLQDIEPLPGIDIVCDLVDLDKHVQPKSLEKLRLSHLLEHFPTNSIVGLLEMLYGLLEPGGEIEIFTPNFRWHADLVQQGQDEQAVYYAFGGQLDAWDFHKTGFTPAILYNRLEQAGFIGIRIDPNTSLQALAYRRA